MKHFFRTLWIYFQNRFRRFRKKQKERIFDESDPYFEPYKNENT